MERLTTNKNVLEMNMVELVHNSCYVKDHKARYRDYETDIDARDLARDLMVKHGFWRIHDNYNLTDKELLDNDAFDETMFDLLQYGYDDVVGLIALFYRSLWAMAELREALKIYEDTGLTPEQMLEIDKLYSEQCRELEGYKNWREYLIDSVENKIKQIKQTQELDDQTLDAICKSVVKAYENVLDMMGPRLEKDGRYEREEKDGIN